MWIKFANYHSTLTTYFIVVTLVQFLTYDNYPTLCLIILKDVRIVLNVIQDGRLGGF